MHLNTSFQVLKGAVRSLFDGQGLKSLPQFVFELTEAFHNDSAARLADDAKNFGGIDSRRAIVRAVACGLNRDFRATFDQVLQPFGQVLNGRHA